MSILAFDDVTLDRGGRRLFDHLGFVLAAGGAIQVIGPNGSGKSSLLRLAAGLLEAEAGRIERPERMALADDSLALDRELPLAAALAFWSNPARAGAALDAAGLGWHAAVPVRFLSSGQRKRATLARVIAAGAPLWLLDEPVNALDADGVARLDQAIASHRSDGGAVLAASHMPLGGDWQFVELGR